ncbi:MULTISPECIES: DUF4178 domain-containing protein [unclassified Actinopolyspora]|uniref:DUF4178 domain-containing protein n=1 Tax=unclassified Actinopolyspora TaxID=2639451 RepID=UPI0013F60BD8|nr:DUF4178 domain-containing protein [Actinopolyspora sp. BKK2]NHE76991.1 DUF4178 domain-containing protein [Actinopolyspora sp. BKK1]
MNIFVIIPIIVLVLVVVAVIVIVTLHGRRARAQDAKRDEQSPKDPFASGDQDALRGDPRELTAGDIVEIRGMSYTVRGTLRLSEGGWKWAEHLLDDARGNQVWLSVEEDPDLILSQWTDLTDEEEAPEPGPSKIELGGRTFRSEESGSASFRSEATTGLNEQGSVRYHDYEAGDGAMLGFESFDGAEWEATRGEELNRYDVRIYPAST